jgi:adenosine deaminase
LTDEASDQELAEKLRAIPKADLHVHLEGTVSSETFFELCRRNQIDPAAAVKFGEYPPLTPPEFATSTSTDGTSHWPRLGGFQDFIRLYLKITDAIRSPEDLLLVGARYLDASAQENIVRSEVYFSASTFATLGRPMDEFFSALAIIGRLASDRYRHRLSYIFDIVRNTSTDGFEVLELAERARQLGVEVGAIGIAGLETANSATTFEAAIRRARSLGYRILVHAGELPEGAQCGASMRDALLLAPDRIGHALGAVDSRTLTDDLRQAGTALELCPWSNLLLQIRPESAHPAAEIIKADLPVIICSDDPGIFEKSLVDNYLLCRRLGVSSERLLELAAQSLQS